MVSGFLISPYDHDRIFSGLAIEMRIWSKTCAGTCGLKRFITSWFIAVSWHADGTVGSKFEFLTPAGLAGRPGSRAPGQEALLRGLAGHAAAALLLRVV